MFITEQKTQCIVLPSSQGKDCCKILGYYWIDGKLNLADIVSTLWAYPQIWHLLKLLLFFYGDPHDLIEHEEVKKEKTTMDA
jgi:hypothetical protein